MDISLLDKRTVQDVGVLKVINGLRYFGVALLLLSLPVLLWANVSNNQSLVMVYFLLLLGGASVPFFRYVIIYEENNEQREKVST